ncbi:hypothetical protein QF027_009307 [Streptomyces canus]|nr:hypothetical protein [Streptomyces canus]
MSLAPAACTLFQKVMRHDPADPGRVGRVRLRRRINAAQRPGRIWNGRTPTSSVRCGPRADVKDPACPDRAAAPPVDRAGRHGLGTSVLVGRRRPESARKPLGHYLDGLFCRT